MTDIHAVIAELKALEAKATPGEWIIDEPHQIFAESCGEYVAITGQIETPERLANSTVKNNAALIAASRNALPQLLAYIERLEAVAELASDYLATPLDRDDLVSHYRSAMFDAIEALDATDCDFKK